MHINIENCVSTYFLKSELNRKSELHSEKWFLAATTITYNGRRDARTDVVDLADSDDGMYYCGKILDGTSVLYSTSDEHKCKTVSDSI